MVVSLFYFGFPNALSSNPPRIYSIPLLMSLTESEMLRSIGLVFLDNIAELTTFAFLQGAAAIIFYASTCLLLQKGLSSYPTRIMLAASTLSFLLVTVYIATFLALFIVEVKGAFVDPETPGRLDVARLRATQKRTYLLELVLSWSSLLTSFGGRGLCM
ncbi:hypothetical protein FPV67DRAFT_162168 [Lyophyllum atratum]|nr:hypothetical protein FPV67DRAFT_162168 [Lyophyllum atratum]